MAARRVRPDELELWQKVAKTTRRMQTNKASDIPLASRSARAPAPEGPRPQIAPFEIGSRSNGTSQLHDVLPGLSERVAQAPLSMDKKTFGRLKRGKLRPEGKLDLHGMTLEQAQPALSRFILTAQAEGKRLVLVVTGKGKHRDDGGPIPTRLGILRHAVPQWLARPPLAQAVLQVSEAHLRHGGGGAYYVYLRRRR